ncbi:MAG: hypothetical protein K5873_07365 [Treponema sp.]|nr:hypothetical protein [Treponema sp.]
MKKIISTLAVLASVVTLASADVKLSFTNKLYMEDPFVEHNEAEDKTETDFPGLINRMTTEVLSERVDAMIKADVKLDDNDNDHYYLNGRVKDWYLEFRPIDMLTLSLHTGIFAEGSYLPIYDDNVNAANIGSDGFTVTLRPIEGLRFGFSAPFGFEDYSDETRNYFNGDKDANEANPFDFRLGAIYGQELFEVGLAIQDVADNDQRQIGAYINLPTLFGVSEKLTVGAGFAHSEEYKTTVGDGDTVSLGHLSGDVTYKNLLSAYATMGFDKFSLSAESSFNLADDDSAASYDLYAAANITFALTEELAAGFTGKILSDISSKGDTSKSILFGAAGVAYTLNERNELGAEFNIAVQDKDWAVAVPVYWQYHFE